MARVDQATESGRFKVYKNLVDFFQPKANRRFESMKENETLKDLYDKTRLIFNFTYPYKLNTYEINHEIFSKIIDNELIL